MSTGHVCVVVSRCSIIRRGSACNRDAAQAPYLATKRSCQAPARAIEACTSRHHRSHKPSEQRPRRAQWPLHDRRTPRQKETQITLRSKGKTQTQAPQKHHQRETARAERQHRPQRREGCQAGSQIAQQATADPSFSNIACLSDARRSTCVRGRQELAVCWCRLEIRCSERSFL